MMYNLRMLYLRLLLIAGTMTLLGAAKPKAAKSPNDMVLEAARSYPDGGGYNWTGNATGVPETIAFKGQTILKKTEGTYCCGFTFAVVMKAASEAGLLRDNHPPTRRNFRKPSTASARISKRNSA